MNFLFKKLKTFSAFSLALFLLACSCTKIAAEPKPLREYTQVDDFLTSRDSALRLGKKQSYKLEPVVSSELPDITIDPQVHYQTMLGFGGAFTEAAAYTLAQLPKLKQDEVLSAYFNPDSGHGYSLCRTTMNSCDFSLENYSYCDEKGDFQLKTFSIEHDRKWLIPMIQKALKLSKGQLKLYASPWSPPAWMKTTGQMDHGGKLKPECRDVWARYFAKYIQAYAQEQIPLWGVTVQNEPESTQRFESCTYTAEEERDFIRDYLGPTLTAQTPGVKILIWDHNRNHIYNFTKIIFSDPLAAQFVWGTGFHWYVSDTFDNVQMVHDAWPEKNLLLTEACQEGFQPDSWPAAERYGRSMIQDLNHWAVGWVDWNMLLNEQGGPTHVNGFCTAPIIAQTKTGEIQYQPIYFYIGHFSRYIKPGAVRIVAARSTDDLETCAFLNPDGSIACVVLNRTEREVIFDLKSFSKKITVSAPSHSIQTFLWH